MKLKCVSVLSDFKGTFNKGDIYEASEPRQGICDVIGDKPKRNGNDWCGVYSLGYIVVLGVAKFEVLPGENPDE